CGALNLFATGVGSSDLAAAMITGRIWLRVPATIKMMLTGRRGPDTTAKDVGLALLAELGAEGANYRTLEFHGPGVAQLTLEDRLVLSNRAVESSAKAAIFPADATTASYLAGRGATHWTSVMSDASAVFEREVTIDIGAITPRLSKPHSPNDVVPVEDLI